MAAPTRRSLANLRRLLGDRLGRFSIITTDADAPDTQSLVASELAGGLDTNAYRLAWVMPTRTGATDPGTSAGKVRRVGEVALNTSTGQLNETVAWPTKLLSGVDVELSLLLPPVRHDGMLGLRECLNRALAEMWMPARLAIAGVANQPSYDLSTYDWLDPGAIRELWDPAYASNINPLPHASFAAVQNADTVSVQINPLLGAGDAAQLEVNRQLDTWIKSGGVWGNSSTGLVADDDECVAQPGIVVEVALAYAYAALATAGEQSEKTYWASKAREQRLKANLLKYAQLAHEAPRLGGGVTAMTLGYDSKDFRSW